MTVGIHRQLDRGVAKPLGEFLRMDALDEERSVGVTRIVEQELGQAVVLTYRLKPAQDVALFERRSHLRGKNQARFLPSFPSQAAGFGHDLSLVRKQLRDKRGIVDGATALVRLGRAEFVA